ncbi:MAG: TIGR02270 family protein [Candidatus Contendobacter sp.]|nr:TIGR02270 family protein [Candidatus Contendobacter sp.]MDS4060208.1 TIGR02270 family protein [Candidatus Contendobacter sp.]
MPATSSNTIQDETTHCIIEETKVLWKKRQVGVDAPYFSLRDLASLDSQINKQLDALFQNSNQSWSLLEQRFNGPQYSLDDLFPATVLAFSENAPPHWHSFLIELVGTDERLITAVIETLGWLPLDRIKEPLLQFLAAVNPLHQHIALAVCARHRADAGDYLTTALQSDVPELRTCALKATGELGRLDLLPALRQHLTVELMDQRFWAAWSAVRMGERGQATEVLSELALIHSPLRQYALALLPRVLNDSQQRQHWLETVKNQAVHSRDAITSVGAAGDPWQIPWLIAQMQHPELARVAGEAFTLITGLDLIEHRLAQPTATNSPNPKDPMRGLPWPNPEAITAWWQINETRFQPGKRYLLGCLIAPDHCLHILVNGYQRQRAAATLELALIQTRMPLFAVHAPATEQQDLLNVRDTLQTCVETAAQLWLERDQAARAPMTTLPALTELDSRLEQQLTLLREAGDLGWKCCWDSLAANLKPGAVFAAAATAVSHPDEAPFKQIVDYVSATPDVVHELIAALGWIAPDHLGSRVRDLLASTSPLLRYVGITACGLQHVDPGRYLDAALKDSGLRLRARALRLVGELRLQRYLPVLRQHLTHANETWRFWAAWSAGLLADGNGLEVLQQIVEHHANPVFQQRAVDLLARAMNLEPARLWIRQLLLDDRLTALVIRGLGILGDSSAIPWLIRCMDGTAAPVAGAAFSLITGVDLIEEKLVADVLEPAEDKEFTNSSSLPYPDSKAVNQWWNQQRRRYKKNRSYLMGFPIGLEVCWQVLVHGQQFQRAAAATELALLEPQTAFFPIAAPSFRQWEWLSGIGAATPVKGDARSTVPRPFLPKKARSKIQWASRFPEAGMLDPSMERSTLPRPRRLSKPVRETDQSLASAMNALVELTQPVSRGWLFRRRELLHAQVGKATLKIAVVPLSESVQDKSRAIFGECEEVVRLPEPTSAAILTARNILSAQGIQSDLDHQDQRNCSGALLKRRKPQPVALSEIGTHRSLIVLSPVTFEWYFERIAEIWQMRHAMATARYSLFHNLCEMDGYLKPYLEYLPEVPEHFWRRIENSPVEKWKAGHLFAASFVALKNNRMQQLRRVIDVALARPRIDQGFISAFGWIALSLAKDKVQSLLNSRFVKWRRLGMMVAMANHIDCKNFLERLANDTDIDLNVIAIKVIGKLGYVNLMPILLRGLRSRHENQRFWAAWSAVLLGNRQTALEIVKGFALCPMPLRQQQALQLILRVTDRQEVDRWVAVVAKHNHRLHTAMANAGACNNIAWVPWLLESMCSPERAGFAGEAFTLLTGVDLIGQGLMRPRVVHPSESQLLGSMELAQSFLPDAKAIQAWWAINRDHYRQDKRYFMGQEVTLEKCFHVLDTGRQYQRVIAALELSLLKADFPLLETQASSFQQRIWIDHLKDE